MKFEGVDSHDWAIFLVHSFDLEGILPTAYHVKVELIPAASQFSIPSLAGELVPQGQSCEFGTGKLSNRTEV